MTKPGSGRRSAGRRLTGRHGRRLGLLLTIAVVGSAVLTIPAATASPTPTVKEVQQRVSDLQDQAEQATEDYDGARDDLKSINVRLHASQTQVKKQHAEVEKARRALGQIASETYQRGQLSTLDLVLGDDPQDALAQAGYLPSLGNRQAGAMARLKQNEQTLLTSQAAIQAQLRRAQLAENKIKQSRGTVLKKLAEANAEVHKLRASQQAQLRKDQAAFESQGLPPGAGGSANCDARADAAPSAEAKTAIRFACAQLGEDYVWGGDGPSIWDCSGLTMRAYGSAGVVLPHKASEQAGYGRRIAVDSSLSNLEPGDLIFFHSPISHVAIYLGNGLMIHAPHSGDVVRVASVYETPSAAVRL